MEVLADPAAFEQGQWTVLEPFRVGINVLVRERLSLPPLGLGSLVSQELLSVPPQVFRYWLSVWGGFWAIFAGLGLVCGISHFRDRGRFV